MIRTFACKDTEKLSCGIRVTRFISFERVARRKLRQLEIARALEDLRVPPGNRLEQLSGNRAGFHSIRMNAQYRICLRWSDDGAEDVEIVDYHR